MPAVDLKYAILHHEPCDRGRFHYRIDETGATTSELPELERGTHAASIGIVLTGNLDARSPTPTQLTALRALLLALKKRYPDIQIGGHRQVRGDKTSCPGRRFPLAEVREWSKTELIALRDEALRAEIDRQYYRP